MEVAILILAVLVFALAAMVSDRLTKMEDILCEIKARPHPYRIKICGNCGSGNIIRSEVKTGHKHIKYENHCVNCGDIDRLVQQVKAND